MMQKYVFCWINTYFHIKKKEDVSADTPSTNKIINFQFKSVELSQLDWLRLKCFGKHLAVNRYKLQFVDFCYPFTLAIFYLKLFTELLNYNNYYPLILLCYCKISGFWRCRQKIDRICRIKSWFLDINQQIYSNFADI